MPVRFALIPLLLALAGMPGCIDRTDEAERGAELYLRYCASCHGPEGRGDGPLAASLVTPPRDLTRLARDAGGHFDEAAVMAAVDGRRNVALHGPREMPVWGVVFAGEHVGEPFAIQAPTRDVRALADHLREIQEGSEDGAPSAEAPAGD